MTTSIPPALIITLSPLAVIEAKKNLIHTFSSINPHTYRH